MTDKKSRLPNIEGINTTIHDPNAVGNWSGKQCPRCGAESLVNEYDDEWCSHVNCSWTDIKTREQAEVNIKPCSCGKTPTKITVCDAGQGFKWAYALPNCCGTWMIEFRTVAYDLESEATKERAIEAWNDAPRAEKDG